MSLLFYYFLYLQHNLLTKLILLNSTRKLSFILITLKIYKQIHKALNKYYENIEKNLTKIINSILNRYKDLVRFDNIKTNNNLITKFNSIK